MVDPATVADSSEEDQRSSSPLVPANLAAAALWWVERGFGVVPLRPQSVEPLPTRDLARAAGWSGQREGEPGDRSHSASSAARKSVRRWWARWPEANVGFSLRPDQVLLRLDDPAAASFLESLGFSLPPTFSILTGRTKVLLFQSSGRVPLRASSLALALQAAGDGDGERGLSPREAAVASQIELQVGGYGVLPPSVLPGGLQSGLSEESAGLEIAEAPRWLETLFSARSQEATVAAEQSPSSGLAVVTAAELLRLALPERSVVLSPWLRAKDLAMVYAWRGVGKTHFALGVAWAVATGGLFLRWKADKPRRVLYIDGEMPTEALQERLRHLAVAQPGPSPDPPLLFLARDLQTATLPSLDTSEGQKAVEPLLDGTDLVILDNLSSLANPAENDAEAWQPMQAWLLELRRRGLAVLLVHHAGKLGDQRGNSKREDILDVSLRLSRPADYQASEGARFEVHFEKSRGLWGKTVESFEARLVSDDRGRTAWTLADLEASTAERVVAAYQQGSQSVRAIARELRDVSRSAVQRHLAQAKADGRLK